MMTPNDPVVGRLLSENPYWEVVRKIPGDQLTMKHHGIWRPTPYGMYYDESGEYRIDQALPSRNDLCRQFSWAIPSPDALDWIVDQLEGRGVVEVACGTGYWAWQLHQLGVDVVAFDAHPPDRGKNNFHSPRERYWHVYEQKDVDAFHERWAPLLEATQFWKELPESAEAAGLPAYPAGYPYPNPEPPKVGDGSWGERAQDTAIPVFFDIGEADVSVAAQFPDRVLFLCWPPFNDGMAVQALRAYTGCWFLYIGEGEGGCTGDDEFFAVLERDWLEFASCEEFVQWDAIHDRLRFFHRRSAVTPAVLAWAVKEIGVQ